jgi:hypothetical protein
MTACSGRIDSTLGPVTAVVRIRSGRNRRAVHGRGAGSDDQGYRGCIGAGPARFGGLSRLLFVRTADDEVVMAGREEPSPLRAARHARELTRAVRAILSTGRSTSTPTITHAAKPNTNAIANRLTRGVNDRRRRWRERSRATRETSVVGRQPTSARCAPTTTPRAPRPENRNRMSFANSSG